MVAILGYSREQIFEAVKEMYSAVASNPQATFHFPVGETACRALGYPSDHIDTLPERLRDSFAGVGYPFRANTINPGDTVLDLGAGAGNDSVIAGRLTGPDGQVIALDLTPAMMQKLRDTVGSDNIHALQGSAESLPLADASVDVITSNGMLNLVPDKRRAVAEMFRVLRPGGRLQIADVVIHRPVSVDCSTDPRLWVECVVGATVDEDFLALFRDAGFEDIQVLRDFDYFSHSPSAQTREIAASFGARAMELTMHRGPNAPSRLRQVLGRCDPRRIWRRMWRRGFVGLAGIGLAMLACYGTLAAIGLLAALGMTLAVNETVWAGTISVLTVLAGLAIAAGIRRHRGFGPALLAGLAVGTVLYTQLISYSLPVELAGFIGLAGAAVWDILLRRREEARVLGLRPVPGRFGVEAPTGVQDP